MSNISDVAEELHTTTPFKDCDKLSDESENYQRLTMRLATAVIFRIRNPTPEMQKAFEDNIWKGFVKAWNAAIEIALKE